MNNISASAGNHFEKVCAQLIIQEVDSIFQEEPRLLDEADHEPLHEMRVGLNRIRNCLRSLPAFTRPALKSKLWRECRFYARQLGAARDFDVAREHLARIGAPTRPNLSAGYDWVLESFAADQAQRREALRRETEQPRYAQFKQLLLDFRERCRFFLEQHAVQNGAIPRKKQLSVKLPEVFARLTADFMDFRAALAGCFRSDEVHRLRKLGKRLRYVMAFFNEYRPATYRSLRRILKDLHDTTGEMHDLDVLLPNLEAKFADLAAREPARGRAVQPGFAWLTRKLYSRRQKLMQRFIRQWGVIHSERFQRHCTAISRPWQFRPPAVRT